MERAQGRLSCDGQEQKRSVVVGVQRQPRKRIRWRRSGQGKQGRMVLFWCAWYKEDQTAYHEVGKTMLNMKIGAFTYVVDFVNMTQARLDAVHKKRKIKRI